MKTMNFFNNLINCHNVILSKNKYNEKGINKMVDFVNLCGKKNKKAAIRKLDFPYSRFDATMSFYRSCVVNDGTFRHRALLKIRYKFL
jgi:hypothetical protein